MSLSSVLRTFWIATLVAFLAMACGCSRHVVRTVDDELARQGTDLVDEGGLKIVGYRLAGGDEREFSGRVRITDQDSLHFWTDEEKVVDGSLRNVEVAGATFDREDVESLSMSEIKVLETVAVTLGVVAVMVGGLVVYAHNNGGLNFAD